MGKLMERKLKDYAVLMLKGMGMGAADVVPGVSGGTIAFIVGIYDELINSIKSINLESLKLFFSGNGRLSGRKSMVISCFSAGRYRYQRIFIGQADYMAVGKPADIGVVVLLRTGAGVYLVCIERH